MISLRSELRRKLLTFFYVNRSAHVYVRQLAAALNADSTNVSRELASLRREGFLRSETEGRQLYYSVNPAYPYLKPVFALLQGSVGVVPTLKHALESVPGIESAWLYGSFAKKRGRRSQRYRCAHRGPTGPGAACRGDAQGRKGASPRNQLHCSHFPGAQSAACQARCIPCRRVERKAHWADWP